LTRLWVKACWKRALNQEGTCAASISALSRPGRRPSICLA
jgi:hypothetical protein